MQAGLSEKKRLQSLGLMHMENGVLPLKAFGMPCMIQLRLKMNAFMVHCPTFPPVHGCTASWLVWNGLGDYDFFFHYGKWPFFAPGLLTSLLA